MEKIKRTLEEAKEIASQSKLRNGFSGQINIEAVNKRPCFSGAIYRFRDIDLGFNPEYPLHEVPKKEKAFDSAFEAVVEHEITHKSDGKGRGCPKNETDDLERILTPVSVVLSNKGFENVPYGTQGHTLYSYFANLFEDFIVNNVVCDNRGPKGLFLLYDDQVFQHGRLGDLFEGFTKLQAMVFPKKEGVSLLLKYFNQSEKAKKAVRNFLDRTNILNIPREQRTDYLSESDKWSDLSRIFTEEFSELIDKNNLMAFYFPLIGGNDFSRLGDEDIQMEIALKAYESSRGKFEPPVFMDNNLALLSLYKQWAKKVDMKVNAHSMETEIDIAFASKRRFDFGKDMIDRLEYGLSEKGRLEAQTGKFPLKVKAKYQVSAGSFPEIRVGLIDCSGSTKKALMEGGKVMNPWANEDKQWTDSSIYHHELMTFFGLCELFRKRGTLKSSNVRLGLYSDRTRMAKSLGESERLALNPDFQGTQIDSDSLKEIFKGSGSIVYTLSDGDVFNWRDISEEFVRGAKKHHYFHYQIGKETQMYRDIKSAGLNVILDRGTGEKSARILIDLTQKNIFGNGGKQ